MKRLILLMWLTLAAPAMAQDMVKPEAGHGWWAFVPPPDTFNATSQLDLRGLNETVAGEHGFIRLSRDGNSFVRGDGADIRFWGGTVYADGDPADMAGLARFLAKRGVNMVRWHGDLMPADRPDSQLSDVNETSLDQVFHLVAEMKKQGIYVTISPYWAFADSVIDDDGGRAFPNWPVPRDPKARNMAALLFFDPVMQKAYKAWIKALFTRVNPYTGLALKDDPAVAIFQIQNEDSLLFWTLNGVAGPDRDLIEHRFSDWLIKRYGSLEAAQEAWNHAAAVDAPTEDRPEAGMMALPNLYELTLAPHGPAGLQRRYADSTEFLTETMRDFNAMIAGYVKNDLGARQLINAGNWRTASMTYLNDAERYSYTPTDVLAVNRYVTGVHGGSDTASWAVAKGERYTDASTLTDPGKFPLAIKQADGHPMLVTESLWVAPDGYESEGPFLVSAMQSLSGVDGFYWFSLGGTGQWDQPRSANGYLPSIGKFVANTPMTLGQFPAAALMYREGYVAPAPEAAVFEHRRLDDLWQRKVPLITEEGGFDPNRDTAPYSPSAGGAVSPLAYLVGPVKVDFGSDKPDKVADLNHYIDPAAGAVTSLTGEIRWNYAKGVATVDTPKAQGVAGFLKAGGGDWRLSDTRIRSDNGYAAIYVISLDGLALKDSHKVLIQVGTQARPTGWEDAAASWKDTDGKTVTGRKIIEHGHGPWLVADTDASVEIDNPLLTRATVLDANGEPVGVAVAHRDGKKLTVALPKDNLYVVVEP